MNAAEQPDVVAGSIDEHIVDGIAVAVEIALVSAGLGGGGVGCDGLPTRAAVPIGGVGRGDLSIAVFVEVEALGEFVACAAAVGAAHASARAGEAQGEGGVVCGNAAACGIAVAGSVVSDGVKLGEVGYFECSGRCRYRSRSCRISGRDTAMSCRNTTGRRRRLRRRGWRSRRRICRCSRREFGARWWFGR